MEVESSKLTISAMSISGPTDLRSDLQYFFSSHFMGRSDEEDSIYSARSHKS